MPEWAAFRLLREAVESGVMDVAEASDGIISPDELAAYERGEFSLSGEELERLCACAGFTRSDVLKFAEDTRRQSQKMLRGMQARALASIRNEAPPAEPLINHTYAPSFPLVDIAPILIDSQRSDSPEIGSCSIEILREGGSLFRLHARCGLSEHMIPASLEVLRGLQPRIAELIDQSDNRDQ